MATTQPAQGTSPTSTDSNDFVKVKHHIPQPRELNYFLINIIQYRSFTLRSSIFSVNLDICAEWVFETVRWWLQIIATCRKKSQFITNAIKWTSPLSKVIFFLFFKSNHLYLFVCTLINIYFYCNITISSSLIQLLQVKPNPTGINHKSRLKKKISWQPSYIRNPRKIPKIKNYERNLIKHCWRPNDKTRAITQWFIDCHLKYSSLLFQQRQ